MLSTILTSHFPLRKFSFHVLQWKKKEFLIGCLSYTLDYMALYSSIYNLFWNILSVHLHISKSKIILLNMKLQKKIIHRYIFILYTDRRCSFVHVFGCYIMTWLKCSEKKWDRCNALPQPVFFVSGALRYQTSFNQFFR